MWHRWGPRKHIIFSLQKYTFSNCGNFSNFFFFFSLNLSETPLHNATWVRSLWHNFFSFPKYTFSDCGNFSNFFFFFSSTCLRPYCIMWHGWGPRDIGHHPVFHSSAYLTDGLQHHHHQIVFILSSNTHNILIKSSSYRRHIISTCQNITPCFTPVPIWPIVYNIIIRLLSYRHQIVMNSSSNSQ